MNPLQFSGTLFLQQKQKPRSINTAGGLWVGSAKYSKTSPRTVRQFFLSAQKVLNHSLVSGEKVSVIITDRDCYHDQKFISPKLKAEQIAYTNKSLSEKIVETLLSQSKNFETLKQNLKVYLKKV